mgnify:CR=1 FL=1
MSTGNGGDFNFYFGRSYGQSNDISRQLNGDICEARIMEVWHVPNSKSMKICIISMTRQPNLIYRLTGNLTKVQGILL